MKEDNLTVINNQNKLLIIIPTQNSSVIDKCLNSLSLIDIYKDVCIVDAYSSDNRYQKKTYNIGKSNEDIFLIENNANYELGAIFKAITHYDINEYDLFLVIHDSMQVIDNIPSNILNQDTDADIIPYSTVPGWKDGHYLSHEKYVKKWAIKSKIVLEGDDFLCIIGCSFLAKKEAFIKIINSSLKSFIPTKKSHSQAAERLTGKIFKKLKYN